MSYWNYRIIKNIEGDGSVTFGIHEVFYDKNNEIEGFTEQSLVPVCPTIEGLYEQFEEMQKAKELPILDMSNFSSRDNKDG